MPDGREWPDAPVEALVPRLRATADPARARAMADYFKREPFLGVGVPAAGPQRDAWKTLPTPRPAAVRGRAAAAEGARA